MNRRVLFVDDEPRILTGLENLLFDYSDDWDMEFAPGGSEAIELLDDAPFDVLVTDMRMPGIDGATLLEHAKERAPAMFRIVLSGQSEVESAMRAVPIAHRYLAKPCRPEELMKILERACTLSEIVTDPRLTSMLGDISDLPPRPVIYERITAIMGRSDWGIADVADAIEQDVALATKILQVANSACFARGTGPRSVREAVARLGADFARRIVLGFEAHRMAGATPEGVDAVSIDGLVVGVAAKELADRDHQADAFLTGLVHHVGKLVIATRLPDRVPEIERIARDRYDGDGYLAEVDVLGVGHAEIGAYLLGLWGMPYAVVEAVCHHHRPSRVPDPGTGVVAAVHVASLVHDARGTGSPAALDPEVVAALEHRGGSLDRWSTLVERAVARATAV